MTIIDSQVRAYEANTPKRPWHRLVSAAKIDIGSVWSAPAVAYNGLVFKGNPRRTERCDVKLQAPVAQLDRAPPSEGGGYMVMFQDSALFPWLTVFGNVMFGLKRVLIDLPRPRNVNSPEVAIIASKIMAALKEHLSVAPGVVE